MSFNITDSITQGWNVSRGADDGSTVQSVTTVVYVIISVFGMGGNGLVLCVVILVPGLRNVTTLLIANQSLVDFTSSVLLIFSFILPPIDMSGISETNNALATILCVVWNSRYLYWTSLKISTGNLICLTLERYIAFVHPHTYRERVNPKVVLIMVLCVWIFGSVVEMPWAFSHFVANGRCQYRPHDKTEQMVIAFVVFLYTAVIPVVVMSFVYISILIKLREDVQCGTLEPTPTTSTRTADPNSLLQPPFNRNHNIVKDPTSATRGISTSTRRPGHSTSATRTIRTSNMRQGNIRNRARRNVMATMFIVCVVYAVCITPNQLYFFLFNLGADLDLSNPVYFISVLMSATNICVNPLIYACKYRKFQMGVRALFCKNRVHVIVG